MVDEILHDGHDAAIVGGSAEHHAVVAESIFHTLMQVVAGNICDGHFHVALLLEDVCQSLSSLGGVAMQGAVGNEDALIFRLVLAPCVVDAKVVTEVFLKHRTMQRTNLLDVERGSLLQEILHHGAILAHNVEVVAASLACPTLIILFLLAESTELTEAVGREENLALLVVGDHHLWPVHHRSHEELQGVLSERERLPFLHHLNAVAEICLEEALEHRHRLLRAHSRHVGIFLQDELHAASVVGFEMLHNQVVRCLATERRFQVLLPFSRLRGIHRVHDGNLLIKNQIGVVGNTQRHFILTFEKVYVKVIHTDVFHIWSN